MMLNINENDLGKVDGRRRNPGRPAAKHNYKRYKWLVTVYDKETNQMKQGKFCSIPHVNEEWNLGLTPELATRIHTKYRTDMTMKKGKSSFLQRWGHIRLERIDEPAII